METLILTLDTIAFMVVIYFSIKGEKLPGKPELGPFRIKADAPASAPAAKRGDPQRPVRRR